MCEPATIISISEFDNSVREGLITYSPLIRPTRTSEIGPLKGISETAKAAAPAKQASASGRISVSSEIKVTNTCVSAW